MRNAFIISVSLRYILGLYAFLEALKLYGHKEDVHILFYPDVTPDHIEKIDPKKFQFEITYQSLLKFMNKYPVELSKQTVKAWSCRFYAYRYMLEMDYDTYFIWQGDLLLLNNVSHYFNIAKDLIVLSNNFNHAKTKRFIGEKIVGDMLNPFCNIPFVLSNKELMYRIWDEGLTESLRSTGRGDMKAIYNSIVDLNILDKVYSVPYCLWVNDFGSESSLSESDNGYYRPDGSRINAVHGPLWSQGFINKRKYKENVRSNYARFHQIYVSTGEIYRVSELTFR